MHSAFIAIRILLLLVTFQISQAREVWVQLGGKNWTDPETRYFTSISPKYVNISNGKLEIALHKFPVHAVEFDVTERTYMQLANNLPEYLELTLVHDKSIQNSQRWVRFAGQLAITEVKATENEPYHVAVTVNMNKGELISLVNQSTKYNISARNGPLAQAKEILYVGSVNIAIGQEYRLLRDKFVDKKIRVTKTTPLFWELEDRDPIFTLITIEDI